jgi:hypothetical protein
MKTTFHRGPFLATLFGLLFLPGLFSSAQAANVRVARFWHNHQPIYWPEWNGNGNQNHRVQFAQDSIVQKPTQTYGTAQTHPDNNLTDIFGHGDRVASYQSGPRNSLANIPAAGGYAISYSGSLIENVRSLGNANALGYGSGWMNGYREATGWTTPSGGPRMDMVGFTYHHSLGSVLPKAVFRKEIQIFKQAWWKAWGKNMDLSDHSKGFFPTEMAFTTEMIDVLRDEGYEWVIVASHHLSRTCPTYLQQGTAGGNYGINSSEPNRADLLGPSPTTGWWYASPNPGNAAWNVAPFAYQLHKVQYVNPETGATKSMIAVPSDDVLSYKAGYSGAELGMVSANIAPYANDPNKPALVLPSTDGDNAWGGGSSSWMDSTPSFFGQCAGAGYEPTSIQDFVNQYGRHADLAHIEDGAWIFPEMCYGSPYFLKWVDPPTNPNNLAQCYPNTQVDLETPGFALKFWNWAPVIAGANWCETAEQILLEEGGTVEAWKIATPYEWSNGSYNALNVAERAWHIYLAGLDSGFNYYGGMGNDDEVKQSLANRRALEVLQPWMTAARKDKDKTPPTIFRPQRFPWNPGGYTFGWFNNTPGDGNFRKKMSSDFYVWTHAYDVSGIPDGGVVLHVRRDKDGVNSLLTTDNETYAGGPDTEDWVSIPMTKRTLPKTRAQLNAAADSGEIDYFIEAAEIADYYFAKVEGYRDALVDYYIETRDTKGNTYKSDIQHVYVENDGTPGGANPSASFSPAIPSDCAPITVAFNAATSALAQASTVYAFHHFSTNGTDWADAAMTQTSSNTFSITFTNIPDNAPQLEICFHNGGDIWENNGGRNWTTSIRDCDAPVWDNGVNVNPTVPTAGQEVAISYDPSGRNLSAAAAVNIHHGYNSSNWTTVPGTAMTRSGTLWTLRYTIPEAATNLVMCFNDGDTWDNNSGRNWTFDVMGNPPPPPVPDGIVITNPATATSEVHSASYTLQGTAGTNLTGTLLWTNAATATGGHLERTSHWSLPVSLDTGTNVITLSAAIRGTGAGEPLSIAADNAAAYSSWADGDNQGSGFGPWILHGGETAGTFLAGSANFNCSLNLPAWGLWANTLGMVEIIRPFAAPLAVGDTFSVQMDNNHVDTGSGVGVALQNATGDTLWQFFFNGGDETYSRSGGETDIGWSDAGLSIQFEQLADAAYQVLITPAGGTTRTYVGMLEPAVDQAVARFRAWNYSSGSGDEANYYVNDLCITRPTEGGEVEYARAAVTLIRGGGFLIDSSGAISGNGMAFSVSSTVPGATYAVYSCTNLLAVPQVWAPMPETAVVADGAVLELAIPTLLLPRSHYRIGYQP